MPSTASVIPMGSEKEAPSFVSQLAPKTYGLGQLDRLLLSAQSIEDRSLLKMATRVLSVGVAFPWIVQSVHMQIRWILVHSAGSAFSALCEL